MPGPSATWNTKRVYITYRNVLSGLLENGNWTAKIDVRVTNTLDNGKHQVFRSGNLGSGQLNTTEGLPSLAIDLPIVNDPQNTPNGGVITLTINFTSGGQETFKLSPLLSWPDADGMDLALILDPALVASAPPVNVVGIPGGVAALDAQGYVLDGNGDRVTGGTGSGSVANWSTLQGRPSVVAAGDTAALARNVIAVSSTSEMNAALNLKVNTSTYTAALALKADLVSGKVPLSQLPDNIGTGGGGGTTTVTGVVKYDSSQSLTQSQQNQAKTNLNVPLQLVPVVWLPLGSTLPASAAEVAAAGYPEGTLILVRPV
jgi:hypothetical protein